LETFGFVLNSFHVCYILLCCLVRNKLLLLGGELLAERCRTDDLMPSILFFAFLDPSRVDSKVLGRTSSSITLSQVGLGRPGGLRESGGGRSAAAMTRPVVVLLSSSGGFH